MKFTLHVKIDDPPEDIKDKIMDEVALYLQRNDYSFDVWYHPNEVNIDEFNKA